MKTELRNSTHRVHSGIKLTAGVVIVIILLQLGLHRTNGEITQVPDRRIVLAVENQLLGSEAIDGHSIQVQCEAGVVTLAGHVANLLAAQQAVRRALRIKGVKAVSDQIVVEPAKRSDQQITSDIREVMKGGPMNLSPGLTIGVDRGRVLLDGTLDSVAEKLLAERLAASVAGVRKVESQIGIDADNPIDDTELEAEIEGLLAISAEIGGAVTEVAVEDGRAVITGRAGSAYEKRVIEEIATLAAPAALDVSGIEIAWGSDGDKLRRTQSFVEIGDGEIVENVRLALRYNPWVTAQLEGIEITSKDGRVVLAGTVSCFAAKQAATESARNTVGVAEVFDRLRVGTAGDRPSDQGITAGVQHATARDAYLQDQEVIVRTRNSHVRLYGLVDTEFLKRRAAWLAGAQPGVAHVANYLTVLRAWQPKNDREIAEAIRQRYDWNLFAPSAHVEVEVEDGVALLSGHVDTWLQWQTAMDLAVEAGARRPHSTIEIRSRKVRGRPSGKIYVPQ